MNIQRAQRQCNGRSHEFWILVWKSTSNLGSAHIRSTNGEGAALCERNNCGHCRHGRGSSRPIGSCSFTYLTIQHVFSKARKASQQPRKVETSLFSWEQSAEKRGKWIAPRLRKKIARVIPKKWGKGEGKLLVRWRVTWIEFPLCLC